VLVHPGKNKRVTAIFDGLEDRAYAIPDVPGKRLDQPRTKRGGLGIGIK
jgi:hypothetical protein